MSTSGIVSIGGGLPTGTSGTDSAVVTSPPYVSIPTVSNTNTELGNVYFVSPTELWVADSSSQFGAAGLAHYALSTTTQTWMPAEAGSPYAPPSKEGVVGVTGRPQPDGSLMLYALTPSGLLYAFNASSKTYAAAALRNSTPNTQYLSVVTAPCAAGPSCVAQTVQQPALPPAPTPLPFLPSSMLLLRLGSGSMPLLQSVVAPLFLDEIDVKSGGALRQRIPVPVPSAVVGTVGGCATDSYSTSSIPMSLSSDRTAVYFTCYSAPLGSTNAASTSGSSAPNPRVVVRVSANGTVDASTWVAVSSRPHAAGGSRDSASSPHLTPPSLPSRSSVDPLFYGFPLLHRRCHGAERLHGGRERVGQRPGGWQ